MWWILAQQTQTNKKPPILDVPNAKKKSFYYFKILKLFYYFLPLILIKNKKVKIKK